MNLLFGLAHLLQAVMFILLSEDVDLDVTAMFASGAPGSPVDPGALEVLFRYPLGPAIALFSMLSAFFHLLIVSPLGLAALLRRRASSRSSHSARPRREAEGMGRHGHTSLCSTALDHLTEAVGLHPLAPLAEDQRSRLEASLTQPAIEQRRQLGVDRHPAHRAALALGDCDPRPVDVDVGDVERADLAAAQSAKPQQPEHGGVTTTDRRRLRADGEEASEVGLLGDGHGRLGDLRAVQPGRRAYVDLAVGDQPAEERGATP